VVFFCLTLEIYVNILAQWVQKPENSLVWHKEVFGWINKYTGLDTTGLAGDVQELGIS
jgi:hypothetical protein